MLCPFFSGAAKGRNPAKTDKTIIVKTKTVAKPVTTNTIISTGDVNSGGKNVEVFSQGQKVIGSNATNINDLPEGTYLLKITNTPAKKMTAN